MGNSLIFIEVFIVYQTAKQTGMISIFLLLLLLFSFLKRRKEDSIKRNKKKRNSNRNLFLSLSLSLEFRRNFSILSQQFGPGTSRWVRGKSVYQQAEINRRWLIS